MNVLLPVNWTCRYSLAQIVNKCKDRLLDERRTCVQLLIIIINNDFFLDWSETSGALSVHNSYYSCTIFFLDHYIAQGKLLARPDTTVEDGCLFLSKIRAFARPLLAAFNRKTWKLVAAISHLYSKHPVLQITALAASWSQKEYWLTHETLAALPNGHSTVQEPAQAQQQRSSCKDLVDSLGWYHLCQPCHNLRRCCKIGHLSPFHLDTAELLVHRYIADSAAFHEYQQRSYGTQRPRRKGLGQSDVTGQWIYG